MAPTAVLSPGKSQGRRSLVGCGPWGREESDTTERLHFHFSLSCIGEGHGNPLQCSCLENPRDGGAWWAAVYGVAQSRTWLKRLSSSSISLCDGSFSQPRPLREAFSHQPVWGRLLLSTNSTLFVFHWTHSDLFYNCTGTFIIYNASHSRGERFCLSDQAPACHRGLSFSLLDPQQLKGWWHTKIFISE